MKNALKLFISTIGILLYIWGFMIGTDIRRTTLTQQPPLFATLQDDQYYQGLGYDITIQSNQNQQQVTIHLFNYTIVNLRLEGN